jgi:hypothetical protein
VGDHVQQSAGDQALPVEAKLRLRLDGAELDVV